MSLFRPSAPERRAIDAGRFPFADIIETGRTSAGEVVNPDTAMKLSAFWRGTNLLADIVAGMPVDVFNDLPSGHTPVATPPQLVDNPSRIVNAIEWRYQAMVSLIQRGNAYGAVLTRDRAGYPTTVEWFDPDTVSVHQSSPVSLPTYTVNGSDVPADDIVHLRRFLRPGSAVGLSVIEYAAEGLGVALAAERHAGQWFRDGAHPTSVAETEHTVDKDQAKTIKDRIMQATRRNREPLVLGAGIKLKPWQATASEAKFLETSAASVNDIARWLGIPAEMLGGAAEGSSLTYATLEGRDLTLLKYTVDSYLKVFEAFWARSLPKPMKAKANTGSLLRTDLKSRYEAHGVALDKGFAGVPEIRMLEDLPPLDEVDLMPLKAKVESVGALVRAGFVPSAALAAFGMKDIEHTGRLPITVQTDEDNDSDSPTPGAPPTNPPRPA